MSSAPDDWTAGAQAIVYQTCACGHVWYFRRPFCPGCGADHPLTGSSAGIGTVYACTEVARAPSRDLQEHAPYTIVIVEVDEGFRMMAHGTAGLAIGDRVHASFHVFGGRTIPLFLPLPGSNETTEDVGNHPL